MKISKIDKDFVNIVNYFDEMGFKPFSSCDGVLANHTDPEFVTLAYISFLKSPKIIDLMAGFFRDKDNFQVTISNHREVEPYYYFGNLIMGNKYSVYFLNKSGDLTSYFEKIIMNIVEGKITIPEEEKKNLNILSEILEDDEKSDLEFEVSFNSYYKPYMKKEGQINVLRIATKEGCGYYRNMHSLIDTLCEKYGIIKKTYGINEKFEENEFAVSCFDGSSCEIYFTNQHTIEIPNLIKGIRKIANTLPTFEIKEVDYDEMYYNEEEPVL